MRTNKIVCAILLLILAKMLCTAQASAQDKDADELLRLEKVWNEAHINNNADALDRLWGDDLTVTVPRMQVLTKADSLTFLRSGRMKFQRYETTDVKVRVYEDSAVVTGRLFRTRTIGETEISDDWRFTKTYIRISGKWQVVAWQASESAAD